METAYAMVNEREVASDVELRREKDMILTGNRDHNKNFHRSKQKQRQEWLEELMHMELNEKNVVWPCQSNAIFYFRAEVPG